MGDFGSTAAANGNSGPATNMMVASMGAQALAAIGGGIAQSGAMRAQGASQQILYGVNATMAQDAATAAITVGDTKARMLATQTRVTEGAQRAAAAGGGVDANTGSAAAVQEDTAGMSAIDQLMIKNNAMQEAFGFKSQSMNLQMRGQMSQLAAKNSANNTILTGGLSALTKGMGAAYWASKNSSQGGGSDPIPDAAIDAVFPSS